MTLKDKFKQWLDTKPREQIRDVQLEVIADKYAIEFMEWCQYEMPIEYFTYHTSIALLEIFKKEKGL